jgi:hypothetical protein
MCLYSRIRTSANIKDPAKWSHALSDPQHTICKNWITKGSEGKNVQSSVLDPNPNPHEFALILVGYIRIQVGKNYPKKEKSEEMSSFEVFSFKGRRLLKYSCLDVFY